MILTKSEELIFALLRGALNGQDVEVGLLESCSERDWEECYRIAAKHGVMAIVWDAIVTIPYELQPPKMLKIRWGMAVENYSRTYQRYCATAAQLSKFYDVNGIDTLLLKGVGLSTYYPVPERRQGGDIDIYTYSMYPDKMSDIAANELADKLMEGNGIEVDRHSSKHSCFNFKGVPIENHKHFLNIKHYKAAAEAEPVLHEVMNPRKVSLCGKYELSVPSPDFNAIFVTIHALQHFMSLSLHHLCDIACVLKCADMSRLLSIGDKRFRNGVKSLMFICKKYLGTDVAVELESEELCDVMLQQMFQPKFNESNVPHNTPGVFFYKLRRFVYSYMMCSKVWYKNPFRAIWDSVVYHIRNPKSIITD